MDPLKGFLLLRDSAGRAPLGPRLVARVRGEDPLGLLHATTSQDVADLVPGRGALGCLLDAKGRIEAEVRILPLADGTVLIEGEPAGTEAVLGTLARVAPLSGCEISDESTDWETVALRGPRAAGALAGACEHAGDLPEGDHATVACGEALLVRVVWGGPGIDILAPSGRFPAIDVPPVPTEALEAFRITAGRVRFGIDIAHGTLLNDTPLVDRAVSFTKGCYPGQESVARVRNLGRPRWRFAAFRADGETGPPPPAGAPLVSGEAEVGTLTSAAAIPEGIAGIARVRAAVSDGEPVAAGPLRGVLHPLPNPSP